MSDLADDIKVEVELPPAEGDNLITNTSGQYGAWQWSIVTGVTGVSIPGDPLARTIQLVRNATAGYTAIWSDFVPVTPGKYANARIDLKGITSGHKVTLGLQFYDSAYAVLSWQYSSPATALDTLAFSSVSIPATAAYAKLIVVLDKTTDPIPTSGSANASAQATFSKAMLTEISTAGTPSVVTTNLMPNGGFTYSTTGWTAGTNISGITRVDTGGGAWVLHAVLTNGVTLAAGERSFVNGPFVGVTAGQKYSIRVDVRTDVMTGAHSLTPGLLYRWYDSSNVQIGADVFLDSPVTDGSWTQFWRILTAPAGATKLRFHPYMLHHGPSIVMGAGWDFEVDSVTVVKSDVLQPFFDGDTPDTSSATYAWTGTAGNSTSTRTSVGAVDYVEPDEQYVDVTGAYNQFTLERSELDVETMSGTVVDPELSPARADTVIVPGRGVRVSAWDPAAAIWRRKFTGTLGVCSVEYDPLKDDKRQKVKITVTATGNTSLLAQASRPDVALTAAALPYLALAGAGVPWNVDGFSGVTVASGVAVNDNATAVDQVALTRDTVGGFAWVDPYGKLWFYTTLGAKSTGPAAMGPDDYTAGDLKVSFSTDRLINSVTVTRLITASDGSTEERVDGQTYEDGASIRRWGRSAAAVTIASTVNATVDAKNVANRILAANATPKLVVEQVAVNSADDRTHAFHDLYDYIFVQATTIDGDISTGVRVTSIKDEITTAKRPGGQGRWKTTYGFMADGGVASPAIQPPVATTSPAGWVNIPLRSGFTATSGETPQYRRVGDTVWLRGRVTGSFTTSNTPVGDLPDGFRPGIANELWATVLGAAGPARFFVTSGGVLNINVQTAGSGSVPISTSFLAD